MFIWGDTDVMVPVTMVPELERKTESAKAEHGRLISALLLGKLRDHSRRGACVCKPTIFELNCHRLVGALHQKPTLGEGKWR